MKLYYIPIPKVTELIPLTCISPANWDEEGVKDVEFKVTNNGYHFTSNDVKFYYHDRAMLGDIKPNFGSSLGGTRVTIIFNENKDTHMIMSMINEPRTPSNVTLHSESGWRSIHCKFNEMIVGANVILPNFISCITPKSAAIAGPVSVSISLNGGLEWAKNSLSYNYLTWNQYDFYLTYIFRNMIGGDIGHDTNKKREETMKANVVQQIVG